MNLLNLKTTDVTKEHLQATSWNDSLVCVCYDYFVRIRTTKPEYLNSLREKMPGNFEVINFTENLEIHFEIYLTQTFDQEIVFFFYDKLVTKLKYQNGYPSFEENLEFLSDMLGAFNAARNEKYIILHAGAVSFNDKTIIFPADSYSGKSTLTAAFVKYGAKYYSDEYAIISEDGFLHPFPKTISMRKPGSYDQTEITVESLGGESSTKPLKIDFVLFTKFVKNSRWNPQKLSQARAVFELLPHAFNGKNNPEYTIRVLHNSIKTAMILQSNRGDTSRFVKRFLSSYEIST